MLINRIKKFFFKENLNQKQIKNIVENIIQISDSEIFYKKYKIPRNFSSKFEIIILFIFLIFNRFKNDKNSEIKLQQIYDFLFDYVDSSLREVGVGDLSVGKKVIELAKIFLKCFILILSLTIEAIHSIKLFLFVITPLLK